MELKKDNKEKLTNTFEIIENADAVLEGYGIYFLEAIDRTSKVINEIIIDFKNRRHSSFNQEVKAELQAYKGVNIDVRHATLIAYRSKKGETEEEKEDKEDQKKLEIIKRIADKRRNRGL